VPAEHNIRVRRISAGKGRAVEAGAVIVAGVAGRRHRGARPAVGEGARPGEANALVTAAVNVVASSS
jgi:hypothetical protein